MKPARRQERRTLELVQQRLTAIDRRCPDHAFLATLMACVRCRRAFEEHNARIARLPAVGR